MMTVSPGEIQRLKWMVEFAGGEWVGIQEPLTPESPTLLMFNSKKTGSTLAVPIDDFVIGQFDAVSKRVQRKLEFSDKKFQEHKMTLKEKLWNIYKEIDAVEKLGTNSSQGYKYVRSVDIIRTVREALIKQKVYAEVNFTFEGSAYTVARAKAPDAPFAARDARCSVLFHDLETNETMTGSGLGTGVDNNDKAIYKAQTGAFKYALKNALMIPDEPGQEMDPEADEYVDEGIEPDFQSARTASPVTKKAESKQEVAKPPKAVIPESVPTEADALATSPKSSSASTVSTPATTSATVATAAAPATKSESVPTVATSEPGTADNPRNISSLPPTEEMLKEYRIKFRQLGDELATKYLKASKSLTVGQKLQNFLLKTENATDPKKLSKAQWDDFFDRADAAKKNPDVGLPGLAKLINRANGIEEKEKK